MDGFMGDNADNKLKLRIRMYYYAYSSHKPAAHRYRESYP